MYLTYKEKEFLLELMIDFNIEIFIFEKIYPIFNDIKYHSNLFNNYNLLLNLLNIVESAHTHGSTLAEYLSAKYLYKVERKLRYKNSLDYYFSFAYKGGYQEVFKLKEEREDRVIIAMDFNSIYPDSMKGDFIEPKSIQYINFFHEKNININDLHNGMYRVLLNNPKETFFKTFHPFKYVRLFESYNFNIEEQHSIEILLFKNELEYYSKFFTDVTILEGFYSKRKIIHPLKKEAEKLYDDRKLYKTNNDIMLSNLTKFKLVTLHSSTNPKLYIRKFFSNKKNLLQYLNQNYMLNVNIEANESVHIKNQENFNIVKVDNGFRASMPKLDANESLYCLSSQVIANSRLKMLQTLEVFLQYDTVEICYCNIDSIHISINKNRVDDFLKKHQDFFSSEMGKLKIESIADKGYWFDIGRYWLFKDDKVIQFRNILFNQQGNDNLFIKNIKLSYIVKNNFHNYVKKTYKNIFNSFSNKKKIDQHLSENITFKRYNYEEIENLDVAKNSEQREFLKSNSLKKCLFNEIATV